MPDSTRSMKWFHKIFWPPKSRTEERIRGFGNLSRGWHHGEGQALSPGALQEAIRLHARISFFFSTTDAFPGLNGEVQITAYEADHCFEFTREPNGQWNFVHELNHEEVPEEEQSGLTFEKVCELTESLRRDPTWFSFTYYRDNSGTGNGNDSAAWPSSHAIRTEEFPLSGKTALTKFLQQPATILGSSIHTLPVSLQYSGKYLRLPLDKMESGLSFNLATAETNATPTFVD